MRKKTHEEFVKELEQLNPNIEALGEYQGSYIKIWFRCKIDNFEWESTPHNVLTGRGCPKCSKKNRKTTQYFTDEIKEINPNIEILSEYKSTHTKIKCRCLIDGNIWEAEPSKLLDGRGCPICGQNKRIKCRTKTHDVFVDEIKQINPNITIVSQYLGTDKPIYAKCNIDGYEWKTTPEKLLAGRGCKQCANQKLRLSNDVFIEKLKLILPNIEPISEYFNTNTYIKYRCKQCGLIHKALPYNLLHGYGCPICNISKGENKCLTFFINHKINYISQYKYEDLLGIGGGQLKFDFAIVDNCLKVLGLVEYDGIFHYEKQYDGDRFEVIQIHDKRKNEYCKEHNIPLLRIPYWEYDNVDKLLDEFVINISQPDCEGKNISC